MWKIRVNPTRPTTWLIWTCFNPLKMTCFDPQPIWPVTRLTLFLPCLHVRDFSVSPKQKIFFYYRWGYFTRAIQNGPRSLIFIFIFYLLLVFSSIRGLGPHKEKEAPKLCPWLSNARLLVVGLNWPIIVGWLHHLCGLY